MTRRHDATQSAIIHAGRQWGGALLAPGRIAERLILLLLLALIPLRIVLGETRTFETPRLFRSIDVFATGPATTFFIVALILAACSIVTVLRLRSGRRIKWTGGEAGAAMMVLAAIIAVSRAGQKHLALIGALDLLCVLIYCFTLLQLLSSRNRIRVALAVIMASAGMLGAKCAYQRWIELPATIRYYEENRDKLVGESGPSVPQAAGAGSIDERRAGLLHDYEARLRSGSATGYFNHPNVLASTLLLMLFVAIGVLMCRWKDRPAWTLAAPLAIAAMLAMCLFAAQSKGAIAAAALAGLLLAAGRWIRRAFLASPRLSFAATLLIIAIAAGGFLSTLHQRPQSMGLSMFYRSMYWRGAASMIADMGIWGIGPDNFGRHFMRYKPIECPEDVDDPHGWPIKLLSEWGLPGLMGMLAVLGGIAWRSVRGLTLRRVVAPREEPSPPGRPQHSIILNFGICLFFFLIPWAIHDRGSDSLMLTLAVGIVPFSFFFIASAMEDAHETEFSAHPLPRIAGSLWAGALGFMMHTGIDLGMTVAGPATLFCAVLALILAISEPEPQTPPTARRKIGPMVCGICGGLMAMTALMLLAIPAARAGRNLHHARVAAASDPDGVEASAKLIAYRAAINAYSLDGTALAELIEELSEHVDSAELADRLLVRLRRLEEIDPWNTGAKQSESIIYYRRYIASRQGEDLLAAIEALRQFVAAAPASPHRWLTLADLLEQAGRDTGDRRHWQQAAEAIEKVLALDERRIYVSKPNRLSEAHKARLVERIRRLRS